MNLRPVPPASFESMQSLETFIQHFEDSEPSQSLIKLAYPIMSVLLPRVGYDLGASEEITEHRANGGQTYLLLDHIEGMDIPTHAAAVYRSRALHSFRKDVDIESKPANLESTTFKKMMVAILLRELSADGIVRGEDLNNERFNAPTDLRDELMARAMELQVPLSVKNINAKRNHATYWPGGRRGKKGRALARLAPGDVKQGVLMNLEGIDDPDNVRLVFVGTNYEKAVRIGGVPIFGASVAISRPYRIPATEDERKQLISSETQKCVDAAAWMSQNLPPSPAVRLLKLVLERSR